MHEFESRGRKGGYQFLKQTFHPSEDDILVAVNKQLNKQFNAE